MTDEEKTQEEKKSRSRKQKRRGRGEGTIYHDKKNDRWVGSFYTGDGKGSDAHWYCYTWHCAGDLFNFLCLYYHLTPHEAWQQVQEGGL